MSVERPYKEVEPVRKPIDPRPVRSRAIRLERLIRSRVLRCEAVREPSSVVGSGGYQDDPTLPAPLNTCFRDQNSLSDGSLGATHALSHRCARRLFGADGMVISAPTWLGGGI